MKSLNGFDSRLSYRFRPVHDEVVPFLTPGFSDPNYNFRGEVVKEHYFRYHEAVAAKLEEPLRRYHS